MACVDMRASLTQVMTGRLALLTDAYKAVGWVHCRVREQV